MSRTRLRTAGLTSTLDLSGKTISNFATTGIEIMPVVQWTATVFEIAGYNEKWH